MEIVLAIGTGLAAGLVHVVSGPDHLAAVLPFAVDAPKRSLKLGVYWGVGHGLGVILLGLAFLMIREVAPIELVSQGSELLVGLLLVGLGVWALRRSRLVVVHAHEHDHHDDEHVHPHMHVADPSVDRDDHPVAGRHEAHHHSTLGFGFVHGLAGVGHLVAASPLLALGKLAAGAYLASYLLAGVLAMTVFARLAGLLASRPERVPTALRFAGLTSVLVGLFWVSTFAFA